PRQARDHRRHQVRRGQEGRSRLVREERQRRLRLARRIARRGEDRRDHDRLDRQGARRDAGGAQARRTRKGSREEAKGAAAGPAALCALTLVSACAAHRPAAGAVKPSAAVEALRKDLNSVFTAPLMNRGVWGVDVRSLDTGERLYALNAGKLMMP